MKLTALFFALLLFFSLKGVKAADQVELNESQREVVALDLERESDEGKYDNKVKSLLKSVSDAFRGPKDDKFIKKMLRGLGKGSAWIATTTAKPFICASGFVTGVVEKQGKNKEIVGLYQFLLKHEDQFDDLYLEAGTPEEFIERLLARIEEITEKKGKIIMKDFLAHLGIQKEEGDFELTQEELNSIDQSKIDAAFINNHPEYQDLKAIIGEMKQEELKSIIASGYYDKAISFENFKVALPKSHELIMTVVGQVFAPKIALGVISKSLAGLYSTPVILADVATGASVAVCQKPETKEKFAEDEELKNFCSYVTNRTAYQLMKSRAKGYVSGKKMRVKIDEKMKARKERREQKRLEKEKKELM